MWSFMVVTICFEVHPCCSIQILSNILLKALHYMAILRFVLSVHQLIFSGFHFLVICEQWRFSDTSSNLCVDVCLYFGQTTRRGTVRS